MRNKCKHLSDDHRCTTRYDGAIVSKGVCNGCEIYKEDITIINRIKRFLTVLAE